MARAAKLIKVKDFQEPMVIFPLKQYESLIEYIENIEDRLTVMERKDEPELSLEEVEKRFAAIFDKQ